MKKRVSVAHYKENLDWLENINKSIDIFIYHKIDDFTDHMDYKSIKRNNDNEFTLRNVGREAHTYLIHIINNYDSLYDIEYFLQGNPLDHSNDIFSFINDNDKLIFEQESSHHSFPSFDGQIPHHMKETGRYDTKHMWDDLFNYPPPKEIEIKPFALLKVPKENILQHSLEIYKKCLEYFSDNDYNSPYAGNFEYFWELLFNEKYHK